ncbi:hypothetical protein BALH_1269 [Bacillus thuringiensis str. Al Hakam]|nr:hypothetical protein BALH_1269 [Bacillus thuringiensis str. Al Hakam]
MFQKYTIVAVHLVHFVYFVVSPFLTLLFILSYFEQKERFSSKNRDHFEIVTSSSNLIVLTRFVNVAK